MPSAVRNAGGRPTHCLVARLKGHSSALDSPMPNERTELSSANQQMVPSLSKQIMLMINNAAASESIKEGAANCG